MTGPVVALLTDFGLVDAYVGVAKGVILSIAPDARLVDLTHDVPPQDVRAGAFALMTSVRYFPPGTVFLAVVDPGVGTSRRPIAVEVGGHRLVGPDNGLLSWAIRELTRRGGLPAPAMTRHSPTHVPPRGASSVADRRAGAGTWLAPLSPGARAVHLTESRFWRPEPSATFHGRDVFGPVAAHLARGVPLTDLGPAIDATDVLPFPEPHRSVDADGATTAVGEVIYVDRFGNLITNLSAAHVSADSTVRVAGRTVGGLAAHFQQARGLIALIGSSGYVEIAVPNGSAATTLGIGVGAPVVAAGPVSSS